MGHAPRKTPATPTRWPSQLKLIKDRLENLRRALRQSSKGSERAATEKMTRRLGEMRDVLSSELAELKDSMTRIGGREEGGDAGRLERVEQMLKVIGKFLQQREREEQQQLQTSIDALRLVTTDIGSFASEDRRRYENVESMATNLVTIAKLVQDIGGGVAVWKDGAEAALVPLPVAGLMSDSPAEEVAAQADAMADAMRACGCTLNNAFMQHSLLALVVIPALRISDQGLVDVTAFQPVSVTV